MCAELGPDFDEFERNLHELRSLNPRQQINDFSRSLLDDLSADAPEIKQALGAPKLNLEQLSRQVLQDNLLDQPLGTNMPTDDAPSIANGAAPPSPPRSAAPASEAETNGQYE